MSSDVRLNSNCRALVSVCVLLDPPPGCAPARGQRRGPARLESWVHRLALEGEHSENAFVHAVQLLTRNEARSDSIPSANWLATPVIAIIAVVCCAACLGAAHRTRLPLGATGCSDWTSHHSSVKPAMP